MTENANSMAYSAVFYIVVWLIVLGAILFSFCQKLKTGASAGAG